MDNKYILELNESEDGCTFLSSISDAISSAEVELERLEETEETIKQLRPNCDKTDYALAAGAGALCGIIDIFLVGKPGDSPLGEVTDKWFEERTMDFARFCGWSSDAENQSASAIRKLEKIFSIPYDQRGAGDAASEIFDLRPATHHFKSLGHNPTLLGLFFSILDQFNNTSHFVSNGELISLIDADAEFELKGNDLPGKLFCGFVNWFGHIISDMSGSSGSKGRGMGIPSPIWSWINDIIAVKRGLNIDLAEFDRAIYDTALAIYKEGFDLRYQTAQLIPVFINEMLVRVIYSVRRLVKYFAETEKENRTASLMWKSCGPFKNPSVRRMLTVAHGTFCLLDLGDAAIRSFSSGIFNAKTFFLRLNIIGVGRFTISLYGEVKGAVEIHQKEKELIDFSRKEKIIVQDYIAGLKELSKLCDDRYWRAFAESFEKSELYIFTFQKSIDIAELRNVPEERILKTKTDIDSYFRKRD